MSFSRRRDCAALENGVRVVVVADAVEEGERASGTSDVKKRGGVSTIDERRCGN
jgi:hypothetical protein